MDIKIVVKLTRALVEQNATVSSVASSTFPATVATAFTQWSTDNNLPMDDSDTVASYYLIKTDDLVEAYLADISGDAPDQFRATAIVSGGAVIGDVVEVAS